MEQIKELKEKIAVITDVDVLKDLGSFVVDRYQTLMQQKDAALRAKLYKGKEVYIRDKSCQGRIAHLKGVKGIIENLTTVRAHVKFDGEAAVWRVPFILLKF